MAKPSWKEQVEAARQYRDSTIQEVNPPAFDGPIPQNVIAIPKTLLSDHEFEITETLPENLVQRLRDRTWTCVEVIEAFLKRAGISQNLVNCVTELLPRRALERAKFLDDHYKSTGEPYGPLHGVPISVKECVAMKDLPLNLAYCSWWGNVAKEDALILQILWKAGAVFHARTTEPQTIMHLETSSNLYGVTVNPHNRKLTPGGSSGGEGALIALRGSCLGIGTDIGGSIRSPAANNGLYGLKPTTYRLPMGGIEDILGGAEPIVTAVGPLSHTINGIRLFMKTILDAKPWLIEPQLVPMPWNEEPSVWEPNGKRKLRIGVLWDDEVVKPHPPTTMALQKVVSDCKSISRGKIEFVDWKPHDHKKAWDIIASLYFIDGARMELNSLEESGEPFLPLTKFIIEDNPLVKRMSVDDIWAKTKEREQYCAEYAAMWNATSTDIGPNGEPTGMVDVVLCPAAPGAAPPLETAKYWSYTSQWNLLDYPALVFPVWSSAPSLPPPDQNYKPRNSMDHHNYKLYTQENYKDIPIGLQLVARPYQEEKLLAAFDLLHHCLTSSSS